MAKSKTSFKKGESGNAAGPGLGKMPEAYMAKERLLSAVMASTTHSELVTAARSILETGDENAEKYLKVYTSASSGLKVLTPEDKEEQKTRIEKNKAERDLAKQALDAAAGSQPRGELSAELLAAIKSVEARLHEPFGHDEDDGA